MDRCIDMDWMNFVNTARAVEFEFRVRSYSGTLLAIAQEMSERNTLSNWVRETNTKIVH